uniref:Uncharacterized protein n=1 Tax=viral metagenome TaxID=1070528 RepID=A0A6C0HW29_9ZZZZ
MSKNVYYEKYLKYKNKYLILKNQSGGFHKNPEDVRKELEVLFSQFQNTELNNIKNVFINKYVNIARSNEDIDYLFICLTKLLESQRKGQNIDNIIKYLINKNTNNEYLIKNNEYFNKLDDSFRVFNIFYINNPNIFLKLYKNYPFVFPFIFLPTIYECMDNFLDDLKFNKIKITSNRIIINQKFITYLYVISMFFIDNNIIIDDSEYINNFELFTNDIIMFLSETKIIGSELAQLYILYYLYKIPHNIGESILSKSILKKTIAQYTTNTSILDIFQKNKPQSIELKQSDIQKLLIYSKFNMIKFD